MDTAELEQIAKWLRAASLSSVEIERPGYSIRISVSTKGPALPQQAPVRAATATTIGTLLDRHPIRAAAFVQIGTNVEPGDVVGLVKNGCTLTPVLSPLCGTVTAVLVPPGTTVDYGRAIIEITAHPPNER